MNGKTVLLIGAGGHARACIDVIEQQGKYVVAGLIGLPSEKGTEMLGYPILGTDDEIPEELARWDFGLVTCGQIKTAKVRVRLCEEIKRHGHLVEAIVSPRAYVSPHAKVGAGSMVLHGAVVNAGAVVGENCIINSLALVEHDAVVGNHCHIATGARLNSGVQVGDESFVGSGCVVRQGVQIGKGCVVGMGLSVLDDCAAGTVFTGKREK